MTVRDYMPKEWPDYKGFRDAAWYPARFKRDRFTLQQLREAAAQASFAYVGWPFLYYSENKHAPRSLQDGIEADTARMIGNEQWFEYWCVRQSGLFYQAALMPEDGLVHAFTGLLWVDETTMYVAEAVDCLGRLCQALGVRDEEVTLRIRLLGVEERQLLFYDPRRALQFKRICELPTLIHEEAHALEDWRAGRIELAATISRELLMRCNWVDPPITTLRSIIEEHFQRRAE